MRFVLRTAGLSVLIFLLVATAMSVGVALVRLDPARVAWLAEWTWYNPASAAPLLAVLGAGSLIGGLALSVLVFSRKPTVAR